MCLCTKDLEKIAALGQDNLTIVRRLLNQTVSSPAALSVSSSLCLKPEKEGSLGQDDFIFTDSSGVKKIKLYYPFNTPYSYVMGYQPLKGKKEIPLPDYNKVKQLIEKSVSMGVDPYLAVSIAQMENPFDYNLVHQHVHDNTAAEVLGCDNSPEGRRNHQIKEWSFDSSQFEKLKFVMNSQIPNKGPKIEVKDGLSYLCVGDNSNKEFHDLKGITVRGLPRNDRYCCMKLPGKIASTQDLLPTRYRQNVNTEFVSNLILFELLKGMQKKNFVPSRVSECAKTEKNINSPEYRIQSFLGFSTNTGTGMPNTLANWRLGVNSCITPTYGIQAMDFMVNTLMPNPVIQKMVEDAEVKFGKVPRHHLCLGSEGKSQSLDLDYFMKQHRDSERFGFVKSKVLAGINFTEIYPKRNMQPLAQELVGTSRIRNEISKKFGSNTVSALMAISNGKFESFPSELKPNINQAVKDYFLNSKFYGSRRTLGRASSEDYPRMSWKKFTNNEFYEVYRDVVNY